MAQVYCVLNSAQGKVDKNHPRTMAYPHQQKYATSQLSDCSAGKGQGKSKTPRGTAGGASIRKRPAVQAQNTEPIEGLRQERLVWHDTAKYQEDTKKYMSGQSCKKRKVVAGWAYPEGKNMRREDTFSHFNNVLDGGGVRYDRIPLPEFGNGQSCIQWWAGWMQDAEEVPKSYNKTDRPKWYSAELLSYNSYGAIHYCGIMQVPQHLYISV